LRPAPKPAIANRPRPSVPAVYRPNAVSASVQRKTPTVANAKLTDRAIENLPGLYASLIDAGAFLPGKAEQVRTLPTTVPVMSDDEIERQLALLKQRLG